MQYNKSIEFKNEQLQKAKNYALSMNGQCLSSQYININEKLEWECHNPKHTNWLSSYRKIVTKNSWCRECVKEKIKEQKTNKNGLKLANEHAKNKEGKCLSTEYISSITKMEWKCNNPNHSTWFARYNDVVTSGKWCPDCGKNRNIQESRARNILNQIFNTKFISCKLNWNINPETGKSLELDGYCDNLKIAFEYQGEQHFVISRFNSPKDLEYLKRKDKYKKENCKNFGIKLIVINYVKNGNNFEEFLKEIKRAIDEATINSINYDLKKLKLNFNKINTNTVQEKQYKKAQSYAKDKGGICLSSQYINSETKMEWKCNNHNHPSWFSSYNGTVDTKSWCAKCGDNKTSQKLRKIDGLKEAKEYAKNRGGECLSTEYINNKTKLEWKCENSSHSSWLSTFEKAVKRNQWCRKCYIQNRNINR